MPRALEQALASLRPGAQWMLDGEQLVWLDLEQDQPSEAELAAEVARLATPRDAVAQERHRRRLEAAAGVTLEDKVEALLAAAIDNDRTALERIATVRNQVRGHGREGGRP